MKTRKSLLMAIVCLAIICAMVFAACGESGGAIVTNGDFENGKADGWTINDTSSEKVTVQPSGSDDATKNNGTKYSLSVNASSAWTYITQSVSLKNNRYYKLSARIKIQSLTPVTLDEGEDDECDVGVVLGFTEDSDFLGMNVTQASITEYGSPSGNKWVECYIYFQAKASADFTLFVGIGNSEAAPSGLVYFDDISVVETDASVSADEHFVGILKQDGTYSMATAGSYVYVVLLALVTVLAAYLLVKFVRYAMGKDIVEKTETLSAPLSDENGGAAAKRGFSAKAFVSPLALFTYAMLGAFIVRFIVTVTTFGFGEISANYYGLYSAVNTDGWGQAYTALPGVPSLSAYVIWIFARIATMLGVQGGSMAMAVTLRIPTVLADIVTCYLIYTFAARYTSSVRTAACYAGFYAVLPVFFTQSALYGSYLSLAMPFVMGMLHIMLLDGKESGGYNTAKAALAGVMFTLALMFDNWVILLLPTILIYQIGAVVKADKAERGKTGLIIAAQAVASLAVFYLAALPMMMPYYSQGSYFVVFDQMYAWFASNIYMSNDAFNMYAMFGLANSGVTSSALGVCTWLFGAALAILSALNYFLNGRSTADLMLTSGVSVILFAAIGTGITVEVMTLGLLLLLAYIILVPDIRLMSIFGALSLTHFLNVAQLIGRGGFIASSGDMQYLMFPSKSAFMIVFSVFTVLLAFALVYVVIDICYYNREKTLKYHSGRFFDMIRSDLRFEWLKQAIKNRKDKKN